MRPMNDDPDFAPSERQWMLERSARAFEKLVTLGNVTSADSDRAFAETVVLTITELLVNSPAVIVALGEAHCSASEARAAAAIFITSIFGRSRGDHSKFDVEERLLHAASASTRIQ